MKWPALMRIVPMLSKGNKFENHGFVFNPRESQVFAKERLLKKIKTGEYKFNSSYCMFCKSTRYDYTLTYSDRYGLYNPVVVCKKCGLVRNKYFLNEINMSDFYSNIYHELNFGFNYATDHYFQCQIEYGKRYMDYLKDICGNLQKKTIQEFGCASGGILYPFFEKGIKVIGYDYNESYMSYGINKGMDLRNEKNAMNAPQTDIIILSHVLEHMVNPLKYLEFIKQKLNSRGIVLAEIPNIEQAVINYKFLTMYLVIAHLYHFTRTSFKNLFIKAGYEVLYDNQHSTIIARPAINESKSVVDFSTGNDIISKLNEFISIDPFSKRYATFADIIKQ